MDGQLRDGVAVIDLQNGVELLRCFHPQPGLDRDGTGGAGKDSVQKSVQLCKVPQHAGALALGGDGAGGAAEVQVHFGIAQLTQLFDHPDCQHAVLCQKLRHHRCPGVCPGVKLCHLLFDEHPVLRRGKKGGVVAGGRAGSGEPLLVHLPPHPVGQALHGGNVVIHGQISNAFCQGYCSIGKWTGQDGLRRAAVPRGRFLLAVRGYGRSAGQEAGAAAAVCRTSPFP